MPRLSQFKMKPKKFLNVQTIVDSPGETLPTPPETITITDESHSYPGPSENTKSLKKVGSHSSSYGSVSAETSSTHAASTGESLLAIQKGDEYPDMKSTLKQRVYSKTQSSFYEDLSEFAEGTVPQSVVVALVVGITCGIAAYLYYQCLYGALDLIWHKIPEKFIVDKWHSSLYVLWIPIVGFTMAVGLGLTVKYMGEPGDLAYTVKCVHEKAYVAMSHVMPMVCASQFSILGGGSLGPEAPLVAICAAIGGFVSRAVFKRTNRNVVRKHTLMGMAGALAAFFGCPLGGSLFALEVNSRFGVEYFEHVVEAIFCGEITLAVFRYLAGLPIAPIYDIVNPKLAGAKPENVMVGICIGLLGAAVATIFAHFHWKVMDMFKHLDLLDNDKAIYRALLGASVVVSLGMFIPQTMFWGEDEFQVIATMSPASKLDHVWPSSGLFGFEMENVSHAFIVGICKLVAISFTVAGGYRGGFIFPFFATGAAFGRVLHAFFPFIPLPIACLGFAAGINTSITRTSLATPLILCFLAGEPNAMSGVLASSLTALFATSYMPFIKSQTVRNDIESAFYFNCDDEPEIVPEEEHHVSQPQNHTSPIPIV